MWLLGYLDAPLSHLLDALFIFLKTFEQCFAFFNSPFSIGVSDLAHVFHQPEIGSHAFRKACHLAKLRNKYQSVTGFLVDWFDDGLIRLSYLPAVLFRVIIFVRSLLWLLTFFGIDHKSIKGWHFEIDVVYFVSTLVITCENGLADQLLFNFFSWVVSAPLLYLIYSV